MRMKKPAKADVGLTNDKPASTSRRRFLKTTAAAAVVAAAGSSVSKYAQAANGRLIKIGFVSPKTGVLADFAQADDFVLGGVRKIWASGVVINGVNHPVQILERDSRSDPNRAAEVTSALIKADKVDLICTANTPDTVNPVSDQAEINGVPCVTTDAPWQAYYFGRGGKPDKGFDWTYHFFWGTEDLIAVYTSMWEGVSTNKVVGALWGNDPSGNSYSHPQMGFPPVLQAKGFKLVDAGRFNPMTGDFSAQISLFKSSNVEILTGTLPPPAFSTFWSQAAQQGFKPKVATVARALLFPAAVDNLGGRATGLSTEMWWSPSHPFKSSLTGQSAAQWCAEYERDTKRQWTQPVGFKHALFEVVADVLKRVKNIDKPESIRDAIAATNLNTIVGHVQWAGKPVKNVCKTPLVGGQWVKGKKWKYDLLIVSNATNKDIPVQAAMKPIIYES
jgi:branched-chain amino acid transport system substrate-binding protein